jgi:hypothetical protein
VGTRVQQHNNQDERRRANEDIHLESMEGNLPNRRGWRKKRDYNLRMLEEWMQQGNKQSSAKLFEAID